MTEEGSFYLNLAIDYHDHPYAYYPDQRNILFASPIEDIRRITLSSPETLRKRLEMYPVDKNFIDWFATLGGKIVYRTMASNGGAIFWPEIWVNLQIAENDPRLTDLVILHELIHWAVPLDHWPHSPDKDYEEEEREYEQVIDEIAAEYLKDPELITYVKEKLPQLCALQDIIVKYI